MSSDDLMSKLPKETRKNNQKFIALCRLYHSWEPSVEKTEALEKVKN